jgi:hypothetical protein
MQTVFAFYCHARNWENYMKKLGSILLLLFMFSSIAPAFAHGDDACAKLCVKCSDMCTENLAAFRKKGGKYAEPGRISLMQDCIAICKLNADFKKRDSASAKEVDKVCSDICHKCADKCEELKDSSLKDCIALCRECADSCLK